MKKITENITRVSLVEAQQGSSDAPEGMIEATATTFGKREGADGRKFWYKPEAFQDWAKEVNNGKSVPMYFNHEDMEMPVGKWTSVEMDEGKMSMKGQLFLNTTRGKDLYTILKDSPEMVNSVSVGAYADEYAFLNEAGEEDDEGDYFQITKGGLSEMSIVMSPNNPNATINKLEMVREDGTLIEKNLEKTLRDEVGLSRSESVAAVRVIREFIAARDEQLSKLTETADQGEPEPTDNPIVERLDTQALLQELELFSLKKALETYHKGV